MQILDKNCSFVPKNVHLVPKNQKFVLFTLKMKFLPNNFTKMCKFWIKTVVLYPKMYIWSWKKQKICTFYSKNEVFAKQFWIKTVVLYPKMYIWYCKTKKIVLFTLKIKFFAKTISLKVQIFDKNCSFVPKNVHLVPKNQKICTFYSKNEVFAKQFH